jgi:hypothetical protein
MEVKMTQNINENLSVVRIILLLLLLLLQSVDIPGLGFGQSEYFPYVYYKVNVDMMDTKA